MKTFFLLSFCLSAFFYGQAQTSDQTDSVLAPILKETAAAGCKCVDSIDGNGKTKEAIIQEISRCINNQTPSYQLMAKLMSGMKSEGTLGSDGKKHIEIQLNPDENSNQYRQYYQEIERYMMSTCPALKEKMALNGKAADKPFSENEKAVAFYSAGLDAAKKEDYAEAVTDYENAVKEDPTFVYAWDNLGLSYRKVNNYDKAIAAYQHSLALYPQGTMPLQNIAIAYQYKKEYTKAIDAYKELAKLDENNPEVFFGIANIYNAFLMDYKLALKYICKAYNLYYEQKSPYRADAEKMINMIYVSMKKEGHEQQFNEILKAHNITPP